MTSFVDASKSVSKFKKLIEQHIAKKAVEVLKNESFKKAAYFGKIDEWVNDYNTPLNRDEDDQIQPEMTPQEMEKMFAGNTIKHNKQGDPDSRKRVVSNQDIHSEVYDKELADAIKKVFGCDIHELISDKHISESLQKKDKNLKSFIPHTGAQKKQQKKDLEIAHAEWKDHIKWHHDQSRQESLNESSDKKTKSFHYSEITPIGNTKITPEHFGGVNRKHGGKITSHELQGRIFAGRYIHSSNSETLSNDIRNHLREKHGLIEGIHYTLSKSKPLLHHFG